MDGWMRRLEENNLDDGRRETRKYGDRIAGHQTMERTHEGKIKHRSFSSPQPAPYLSLS